MTYTPISIREAVAAKLANSGEQVVSSVIDALANAELSKRESALLSGLTALDKLERDIRKIRPDQRSLNVDGSVSAETFSPAKYDELKRAKEQAERYQSAIAKALNERDFSKLNELTAKADAKPSDA
jgi:hypothetical protein